MRSHVDYPGADDPAYAHELGELAARCKAFIETYEDGDFDGCMFNLGSVTLQCAAIYRLSDAARLLDLGALFRP